MQQRVLTQRVWGVAALLGLLTAGLWPVVAAAAPAPPAPGSPPSGPDRIVIEVLQAPPEARSGGFDPARGAWVFEPPKGRVRVLWRDWEIEANRVAYFPGARRAELSGSVSVRQPDLNATAAEMVVLLADERATLTGDVRLEQWEAGSGGGRGTMLRSLKAQTVQVDQRAETLQADGAVLLEQRAPNFLRASGQHLEFHRESGKAVLTGPQGVEVETAQYRVTRASRVEANVDTEEITLFGPARIQEKDAPPGEATGDAGPSGGAGSGPGAGKPSPNQPPTGTGSR